jgi:hypothetical protein
MKEKVIRNVKKYKYDLLGLGSMFLLLITKNLLFLILFFIFVVISEFKK